MSPAMTLNGPHQSGGGGGGGAPTGAAGGDLTGTYPNPTLATRMGGATFPGTNTVASFHPLYASAASTVGVANQMVAIRVVIPKTGTIADFSYYTRTTAAGNVDCGIYSTAATRVLLWSSGSTTIGGSSTWQSMGNPALAVTAGDQYDFAICMDTVTTVTFAGTTNLASATSSVLPASYLPSNGASPKLNWSKVTSFPLATNAATVAEGSCAIQAIVPLLIARIT